MLLNQESEKTIAMFKVHGWHIMLSWSDFPEYGKKEKKWQWEVNFTKEMCTGRYDNHESGYSEDINEAVRIAAENIKLGKRLRK